jgi:hypothetical protein
MSGRPIITYCFNYNCSCSYRALKNLDIRWIPKITGIGIVEVSKCTENCAWLHNFLCTFDVAPLQSS